VREVFEEHFVVAGHLTPAVGALLVQAEQSGVIAPTEAIRLVRGSSPITRRPGELLARVGEAVRAAGAEAELAAGRPLQETLAALRRADAELGQRVDDWLADYGWKAVGADDVSERPLLGQPDLVLSLLRSSVNTRPPTGPTEAPADALKELLERLPAADRPAFAVAVEEARTAAAPREVSCELVAWSIGLVWRVADELGRREVAAGRLDAAEQVECCLPAELADAGSLPDVAELRARADRAALAAATVPPLELGTPGAPPPSEWLPDGARQLTEAVMAFLARYEAAPDRAEDAEPLTGLPVSPGVVEGRAFVLTGGRSPSEVRHGDVLVALSTSASLNSVLSTVAGLVTEYGGLVCHAAIVSRELGFPGVVGCEGATRLIPHGALVRVHGDTGRVEVLAAVAPEARSVALPAEVRQATPRVPERLGSWVPLAAADDPARYGGKAARLAAAVQADQRVPKGVALDVDLVEGVAAGDERSLQRLARALATLRAPLAVRSSAPAEDGAAASFAGLHQTVLGLREDRAVVEAVAAVWASAHAPAAMGYRARLGIGGRPQMAVILQEVVAARVAGVRFARDPVTGETVEVIEAAPGLGVAVVDGLVRPDRFRVSPDGRMLVRGTGDKRVRVDVGERGLAERAVEEGEADAPCLDDAEVGAVVALGQRCDRLFGGPQDIEWAVAQGTLWLLQSRPVTTGGAR
jgi:pyruvate,water dikinase